MARLQGDLDDSLRREDIECFKNAVRATLDEEPKTVRFILLLYVIAADSFILLLYINVLP